jgi:hypothetical protein
MDQEWMYGSNLREREDAFINGVDSFVMVAKAYVTKNPKTKFVAYVDGSSRIGRFTRSKEIIGQNLLHTRVLKMRLRTA